MSCAIRCAGAVVLCQLLVVMTSAGSAAAQTAASDDFNSCTLNQAVWTLVDPVGGGSAAVTGMGTQDAQMLINVPAGSSHDAWADGNHSVRVLQAVSNTSFEIQLKFDSRPLADCQIQGVLVEEDSTRFLRFDTYSDGTRTYLFCATINGGSATIRRQQSITGAAPFWFSIRRNGDSWTMRSSTNGTSWTDFTSFSFPMAVAKVGPFAGNYSSGSAPAYTAKVDYFMNVAAPFTQEDGTPAGTPAKLTTSITGQGQIVADPPQTDFFCGETVSVAAVPSPGWVFESWTGDLSGTTSPQTLVMDQSHAVGAVFVPDGLAPVMSNIQFTPGRDSATVTWVTDVPADGRVSYGTSVGYELGTVTRPDLVVAHAITLSGLTEDTEYHLQIASADGQGDVGQTGDLVFRTVGNVLGVESEDFNDCALAPGLWTLVDPVGGGSVSVKGVGTGEAWLELSVPAGASHDVWTDANNTVRALQNAANVDFEVQAKFLSKPVAGYQIQGLLAEQDAGQFLRFDVGFNGYSMIVFSASIGGGKATIRGNQLIASGAPIWLSIKRQGDQWTLKYSYDGTAWITHATFTWAIAVNKLGPFAGNYSAGVAPAFLCKVDYLLNMDYPFAVEDGPVGLPGYSLSRSVTGEGTIEVQPAADAYYCNDPVTVTAVPRSGWRFVEWGGDLGGTTNPETLVMSASRAVTATFAPDQVAPVISQIAIEPGMTSATVRWTTDVAATSKVLYGLTTDYEMGTVEDAANFVTAHALTVTGLEPDTAYHAKIVSVDSGGDLAESGDLSFTTPGDPTGIISDDFNTCALNTGIWSVIDPLGGATVSTVGTGSVAAQLVISVPGGHSHDLWAGYNESVRVMQTALNVDFEIETKFESQPTAGDQMQGLLIEQDSGNWIRYDVLFDGSRRSLFAGVVRGGSARTALNQAVAAANPLWLGVTRVGNVFTLRYSLDGVAWANAAAVTEALAVSRVGVFAGNYSYGAAPAYTARVDYFLNTAAPFADEDGPRPGNVSHLITSVVGNGTVEANPSSPAYYCGETVTVTATPQHGWLFAGWSGDVTGTTNPLVLDMSTSRTLTAEFVANPSTVVSDDFNVCSLNTTRWQVVNPLNDATFTPLGAGSQNAGLRISIPAGTAHDLAAGVDRSPRIVQPANDTDFEVLAKFDSAALAAGQLQGVLIGGSGDKSLRFEFRNAEGQMQAVGTVIESGVPYVQSTMPIPQGGPSHLRVRREGDEWTLRHSLDGSAWADAGSFSYAMVVTAVGSFAGTTGATPPAFLCTLDYFFNAASPIVPEDGPLSGTGAVLTLSVTGEGSIVTDPAQSTFYCGESVTLRAEPALGWMLEQWGGDLSGTEPVQTLAMTQPRSVEATFVQDLRPIYLSEIKIVPGETSATVTWKSNKPTTTSVMVGITEYGPPIVVPGYRTEHTVEITGLTTYTHYWAAIVCQDANGGHYTSTDMPFTTLMSGGFNSDDFNAFNLNGRIWKMYDPLGDASFSITGTNTPDARLRIIVPAGTSHGVGTDGIKAPHVMQRASNVDFGLEAKFESVINRRYQMQGVIIQQDADTFIRCEFYSNGSSILLLVGTFDNGVMNILKNQPLANGFPWYMRLTRTGNHWQVDYSNNGVVWNNGASFDFTMIVASVGPFVGNEGTPAPAFTGLIDYFFNTAGPISPEDGTPVQDTNPPNLMQVATAVDEVTVDVTWTTDEPATSAVKYGVTTEYEEGTQSDSSLTTAHMVTISNLKERVTYNLQINSADASGNVAQSENIVIQTGAINNGPILAVWYGASQEFGRQGKPQPAANILGNAADSDGLAILSYSLNRGPQMPLSIGPDTKRLARAGDFNVDIPFDSLLSGTNDLVLTATDALGKVTTSLITIVNSSGPTWPLPYTIDWAAATSINEVAQVVDGNWVLEGGVVRPALMAYDRLIAFGDLAWTDYEVTVPITVHAVDPAGYQAPSFGPGVGMVFRWPGHSLDGAQPASGVYPLGAIGMYRWTAEYERFQVFGNNGTILASAPTTDTLVMDVTYVFKMRVETLASQGKSRYWLKYWRADAFEPFDWQVVGEQSAAADPGQGSVLLLAHHVDATFGNVVARPGPFQDGQPLTIGNVQVAPLDHSAAVTWQTSDPTTSRFSFGLTDAHELGTITDPSLSSTHSISLADLQPQTVYHYEIVAMRADGIGVSSGDLTFTTTFGCEVDTDGDGTVDCHDGCPEDPAKIKPGVCGCGVPETACNGLPPLPTDWLDTGANNSLVANDALFGMFSVGGIEVFGTTSIASNIHSHYVGGSSHTWSDYEFSGSMMITSPNGGIGVTLFSDYPNSDSYYRLRRYSGYGFHVSPHPNGIVTVSYGTTDTGVTPQQNVWYAFRMRARNIGSQTWVGAKVWRETDAEPTVWQVDCVDAHANRLTAGTVGVWTMGPGSKYWKNLRVQVLGEGGLQIIPRPDPMRAALQFPDPMVIEEGAGDGAEPASLLPAPASKKRHEVPAR